MWCWSVPKEAQEKRREAGLCGTHLDGAHEKNHFAGNRRFCHILPYSVIFCHIYPYLSIFDHISRYLLGEAMSKRYSLWILRRWMMIPRHSIGHDWFPFPKKWDDGNIHRTPPRFGGKHHGFRMVPVDCSLQESWWPLVTCLFWGAWWDPQRARWVSSGVGGDAVKQWSSRCHSFDIVMFYQFDTHDIPQFLVRFCLSPVEISFVLAICTRFSWRCSHFHWILAYLIPTFSVIFRKFPGPGET